MTQRIDRKPLEQHPVFQEALTSQDPQRRALAGGFLEFVDSYRHDAPTGLINDTRPKWMARPELAPGYHYVPVLMEASRQGGREVFDPRQIPEKLAKELAQRRSATAAAAGAAGIALPGYSPPEKPVETEIPRREPVGDRPWEKSNEPRRMPAPETPDVIKKVTSWTLMTQIVTGIFGMGASTYGALKLGDPRFFRSISDLSPQPPLTESPFWVQVPVKISEPAKDPEADVRNRQKIQDKPADVVRDLKELSQQKLPAWIRQMVEEYLQYFDKSALKSAVGIELLKHHLQKEFKRLGLPEVMIPDELLLETAPLASSPPKTTGRVQILASAKAEGVSPVDPAASQAQPKENTSDNPLRSAIEGSEHLSAIVEDVILEVRAVLRGDQISNIDPMTQRLVEKLAPLLPHLRDIMDPTTRAVIDEHLHSYGLAEEEFLVQYYGQAIVILALAKLCKLDEVHRLSADDPNGIFGFTVNGSIVIISPPTSPSGLRNVDYMPASARDGIAPKPYSREFVLLQDIRLSEQVRFGYESGSRAGSTSPLRILFRVRHDKYWPRESVRDIAGRSRRGLIHHSELMLRGDKPPVRRQRPPEGAHGHGQLGRWPAQPQGYPLPPPVAGDSALADPQAVDHMLNPHYRPADALLWKPLPTSDRFQGAMVLNRKSGHFELRLPVGETTVSIGRDDGTSEKPDIVLAPASKSSGAEDVIRRVSRGKFVTITVLSPDDPNAFAIRVGRTSNLVTILSPGEEPLPVVVDENVETWIRPGDIVRLSEDVEFDFMGVAEKPTTDKVVWIEKVIEGEWGRRYELKGPIGWGVLIGYDHSSRKYCAVSLDNLSDETRRLMERITKGPYLKIEQVLDSSRVILQADPRFPDQKVKVESTGGSVREPPMGSNAAGTVKFPGFKLQITAGETVYFGGLEFVFSGSTSR